MFIFIYDEWFWTYLVSDMHQASVYVSLRRFILILYVGAHPDSLIAHQMTPRPLTSDVPEDPETMIAENAKNNILRETL